MVIFKTEFILYNVFFDFVITGEEDTIFFVLLLFFLKIIIGKTFIVSNEDDDDRGKVFYSFLFHFLQYLLCFRFFVVVIIIGYGIFYVE